MILWGAFLKHSLRMFLICKHVTFVQLVKLSLHQFLCVYYISAFLPNKTRAKMRSVKTENGFNRFESAVRKHPEVREHNSQLIEVTVL